MLDDIEKVASNIETICCDGGSGWFRTSRSLL